MFVQADQFVYEIEQLGSLSAEQVCMRNDI